MSEVLANNITRDQRAANTFEIFISDSATSEGDQIKGHYSITQLTVNQLANKVAFAKLVLNDGEVAKQDFQASNEDTFAPGKFITIRVPDTKEKPIVFKGIIVKHGIRIRKNGVSQLRLDCRDAAVMLTTETRFKYFAEETTDSEAFDEIAAGYEVIETAFEATNYRHKSLVQYNASDWDFLVRRANSNGQLVYTDSGTLTTVTPTVGESADFTVEFGTEIIDFEAEMDVRNQYGTVIGKVWDSSKQDFLEEEVSSPATESGSPVGHEKQGNLEPDQLAEVTNDEGLDVRYAGQLEAEELKQWMNAELIRSRLSRIRGRACFVGTPTVKPGKTVEFKGVGERFNGLAYITGVTHEFGSGQWQTHIQFGLERNWATTSAIKKHELIPSMSGLYIGIVTRLDDDGGQDRIKVSIPLISGEGEGIWAKIARPDAGEHRGLFFLPEPEDEVLVGFLDGDPRFPIVLGMLNSSMKPAPLEAKAEDNKKGYYSKIGSRLEFDDKERLVKIQTLSEGESGSLEDFRMGDPEQDKNNTIILDDKNGTITIQDKNKNSIELSQDGITIKGDKKITLEAPDVEIKASGELKTDTGKSSLSSSGETSISGAKINLN